MEQQKPFLDSWMYRFSNIKKGFVVLLLLGNVILGVLSVVTGNIVGVLFFSVNTYILCDYVHQSHKGWDKPAAKQQRRWDKRRLES